MTQETGKLLPLPDEASQPFYDGAMEGRLMLMKCTECGQIRLPSRRHCDECLSSGYDWIEASGQGAVRTFAVMHQLYHPGFARDIPYNVTIVELDEGPRLPTNLVEIANSDIRVGMRVRVEWERHSDVALPKFRPT